MGFTIYNDPAAPANPAPFSAAQSRWDKIDVDTILVGFNGNSVSTGCAVTAQGSPNNTVAVSAGTIMVNNAVVQVAAVPSIVVPLLPPANNRRDLVVVNSSGVVSVVTGSVVATIPDMPNVPANSIVLAVLDVGNATTAIATANISDRRVVAPINQTQVLGSTTTTQTLTHQGKPQLLLSGTWVAWAPTQVFRIDFNATVLGGGYGIFAFLTGVNGGLPNSPLYSPSVNYVSGGAKFAAGVTEGNFAGLPVLQYEQVSTVTFAVRITGLTVGRTYTWQLEGGCTGAASTANVGRNPFQGCISPDNRTAWVSNFTDNTIQPVSLGVRPNWGLGQAPYATVSGPPIKVGVQPWMIQHTGDGKYVLVVNSSDKTVTVVNALTRQVVGTTGVLSTTALQGLAITLNADIAWVSDQSGKVYPITIATATGGAGVTITGAGASDVITDLVCSSDGKTLWAADYTQTKLYPLTLPGAAGSAAQNTFTTGTAVSLTVGNLPRKLATCRAAANVGAGTTLTAAPFDLTFAVPPAGYNNFPTWGGTIRVPTTAGPPIGYTTLTYTSTTFASPFLTFKGCTGGGGQVTVAGNVVIDESAWATGDGSIISQVRIPGIVQSSAALGGGALYGLDVLSDGQEVWACSNATPGKYIQLQTSDMAVNTPLATSAYQLCSVFLSTDGYVLLPACNNSQLYDLWGGQVILGPGAPFFWQSAGVIVSASGAA